MTYFLHYDEKATINYCFLFSLYLLAERNEKERLTNLIQYENIKDLSMKISVICGYDISQSTIYRILNNEEYNNYFSVDRIQNKIYLSVSFRKGTNRNKFVTLKEKELLFLIMSKDNFLIKYYLYLKYYCGYSKSKKTDTTASQALSAMGYSSTSNSNKAALSKYNKILVEKGFLSIQ